MRQRLVHPIHKLLVVVSATLVASALLTSAALAGTAAVQTVDTAKYRKAPPWTVCFSNASVSNSWRVFMVQHLKYEASLHHEIAQLRVTDAQDNPAKQISDTEDLLARGCDVLIMSPATQDALTPVAARAMAMGVPVVTVDRNVSGDHYVTFVESSNYEMGRIQAEWLVEQLGGRGNVVLLSGVAGASPAEDRLRGARDVFKKNPGIRELAQAYTDWSPVRGKQIMENWLVRFPKIDGVWADSGLQGSGAVEAIVEAGKPVPPITGEDFNRYLKQWKRLGFQGIGVSFPTWQGSVAVQTAIKILRGEPVPHYIDVPRTVITQENLDKFARLDMPDDFWADIKLPDSWLPK